MSVMRPDAADLYFEFHITIDPVQEHERGRVGSIAQPHKFKLAKLLMDKGVPSQLDTFMTGHGKSLSDLDARMRALIKALQKAGLNVRRYKIEDTVLDSRAHDVHGLLKGASNGQ